MLVGAKRWVLCPPSWPTPSACCWSTRRPPTRRGSTAPAQVRGASRVSPPPCVFPLLGTLVTPVRAVPETSRRKRNSPFPQGESAACPLVPPSSSCQVWGWQFFPPPPRSALDLGPCSMSTFICSGRVPGVGGAHGCSWGRVCTPSTHELAVGVMSGDGGVWGSPPPHLSVPLPAPDFDPSDWTNEKEKLGLDFPNVGDGWGMGGQGGEGAGGVRGLTPPCPPPATLSHRRPHQADAEQCHPALHRPQAQHG